MSGWVTDEHNDDIWRNSEEYCSREEAIKAGRREYDGEFYIGKAVPYIPRIDADNVIEQLQSDAFYTVGEGSEGWLPFKYDSPEVEDLQTRLQSALDAWLEIVGDKPSFYAVREVELIEGDTHE